MNDLVTWLRAQLDEDERMAQAAGDAVVGWVASETADNGEPEVGLHIERWRPARVLAEVEAKRRILDLHAITVERTERMPFDPFTGERQYGQAVSVMCELCGWAGEDETTACATVCLLALPYAGRPGYREEWRP